MYLLEGCIVHVTKRVVLTQYSSVLMGSAQVMCVHLYLFNFLQTLQYFEQLKNSVNGWKLCAADLTKRIHRYIILVTMKWTPIHPFVWLLLS